MNEIELAWLAGLLEGEGSFGLTRYASGTQAPQVQIRMSDLDVIERARVLIGVNRYSVEPRRSDHKTIYLVRVRGKRAAELMRMLLPYMGERRSGRITEILNGIESGEYSAPGKGNWKKV